MTTFDCWQYKKGTHSRECPRCSADLNAVCRLDSSDPAASVHLVGVAAEDVPVEQA